MRTWTSFHYCHFRNFWFRKYLNLIAKKPCLKCYESITYYGMYIVQKWKVSTFLRTYVLAFCFDQKPTVLRFSLGFIRMKFNWKQKFHKKMQCIPDGLSSHVFVWKYPKLKWILQNSAILQTLRSMGTLWKRHVIL